MVRHTNTPGSTAAPEFLARVHQIATDYAGGFREGLGRAAALAEIAALTIDPDVLARAAAQHAVADNWYAINAVDLLLDAGAPPHLVDRYLNQPHDDAPTVGMDTPVRRAA